jgi:UDP-N-acetylmuramoyl-tripeptide--D-alanyl-D-alanine ligase
VIPLSWDEVVALGLGRLERGPRDVTSGGPITGIEADSRAVGPGDLFVALNAGVDFVDDARQRGAASLVPSDQHAALAALARLVRSKSAARVVAVVGSTGKTTTKDILGALCASVVPTISARASLNNEIGLPLTVCRLEQDTEILVVEMGMRGLGQIAALCEIARPDVVLVTSIGAEHLELLGSVENVARANAEAIDALPTGGIAVVPAAERVPELVPFLRRDDIDIRRFDPSAVTPLACHVTVDGRSDAEFRLRDQTVQLELPFTQRHLLENTLAALTAYEALGLPLDRVHEGASRIELSPWRGEERALPGGGFVINDAYNANPISMRAALLHLTERAAGRRRVAILGEMAELGDHADVYHREIGAVVAETVDVLVTVGDLARLYMTPGTAEMRSADGPDGLEELLGPLLRPGDAVLVKASRAVGLEGIPERVAKIAQTW